MYNNSITGEIWDKSKDVRCSNWSVILFCMFAESGTDKHVEHVIPVNFTARSQEDLVAYFREDVDLNAFNMYFRYIYPSWFNTTLYGKSFDRRGEQFYYTYHQIYARYFLERLSNSLPDVKPFQYSKPLKVSS